MKLELKFQSHFNQYLNPRQFQTLSLLIYAINQCREVKIERLATYFPLPILFESRRRHIQRFLVLQSFSVCLIWFPIIKKIIFQLFSSKNPLVIVLDRTQWSDINIFMITVIWNHRGIPIFWDILDKKGASNLGEQKALIRPIIKLLKKYHLIIIGDREFHSIKLCNWLTEENKGKKRKIDFIFRQKENTYYQENEQEYQQLSKIKLSKGIKQIKLNVKVTKYRGFSQQNLVIYQRKKKKNKNKKIDKWLLLTSLENTEQVVSIYSKRMGIETMFKDYKSGGYNLEGSKAKKQRLCSLLLLIAISYTGNILTGKKLTRKKQERYINRGREKGSKQRRQSNFWVGIYGKEWIDFKEEIQENIKKIMELNKNKLWCYRRGIRAKEKIREIYQSQ